MTSAEIFTFAAGLLAIMNPPSLIPAYTEIIEPYPDKIQRRIALRTTWSLLVFMWFVLWLGQYCLQVMAIEIGALQAAGGLVLLRVGFRLVDANDKKVPQDEMDEMEERWKIVAVVPLAIPLTAGGGTMALIVATAAQAQSALDVIYLSAGCLVVALIIGITYYFAMPIRNWLGTTVMRIMVRISGIILIAIAIQLLVKGSLSLIR